MYYENIEDFNPNIKLLNEVIIMGPQEEILKKLDYINSNWLTPQWLYRNRSRLEIIEPLRVTKTFRWSPGYKQKIIKVIDERCNQYHKVTSKLDTLLLSRPFAMKHTKEKFIQKVIEIDADMRLLRLNGTTFADNSDKLEESLNDFKKLLDKQIKDFEKLMTKLIKKGHNVDWNIGIQSITDKCMNTAINNNHRNRKLTKDEIEVGRYENSYVVFSIKWLKPQLVIFNKHDKEIGKIDHEPIHLVFHIKINRIINLLALGKGVNLETLNARMPFHGRRHMPWSFSNNILRLDVVNNYSVMGKFDGEIYKSDISSSTRWNGRIGCKLYPYISSSTGSPSNEIFPNQLFESMWEEGWHDIKLNTDSNVDRSKWNSICLGSVHTEIMTSFLQFDFVGMFLLLQKWQEFHLVASNPLNQLRYLMDGMPSDKSPEFVEEVGLDTDDCAKRLAITYNSLDTSIHRSRNNEQFINWYDKKCKKYHKYLSDIDEINANVNESDDGIIISTLNDEANNIISRLSQNINSMLAIDTHCNTIECQFRDRCWSYLQRSELWKYISTGEKPENDDKYIHHIRCDNCRLTYHIIHSDYEEHYEVIDNFVCYECDDDFDEEQTVEDDWRPSPELEQVLDSENVFGDTEELTEITQEERENQMRTWVEVNQERGGR